MTQIKAIDDQNSAEFRSAVAKLKSTISAQFDEKLLARNAELAQLEKRIKTARQRLKKREVNRDEILKQRIRKILIENGIELSEPLNKDLR